MYRNVGLMREQKLSWEAVEVALTVLEFLRSCGQIVYVNKFGLF